jgi:hypothetical protein
MLVFCPRDWKSLSLAETSPCIELDPLLKVNGFISERKMRLTDRDFCLKERYGKENEFFYGCWHHRMQHPLEWSSTRHINAPTLYFAAAAAAARV